MADEKDYLDDLLNEIDDVEETDEERAEREARESFQEVFGRFDGPPARDFDEDKHLEQWDEFFNDEN